jgi:hypothetical protein
MAFVRPMAKKPEAPAAKKGEFVPSKPVATLSVQAPGEDKSQIITGLFENTNKKGEKFMSGKDKESQVKYYVQDGKQGKRLSYSDDGKTFNELCILEEKQGKQGKFLVGVDKDQNKFFVFPKREV